MLLLDDKLAFDRAWHDGLIYKLIILNCPHYLILGLVQSFLWDRSFRVRSGQSPSNPSARNSRRSSRFQVIPDPLTFLAATYLQVTESWQPNTQTIPPYFTPQKALLFAPQLWIDSIIYFSTGTTSGTLRVVDTSSSGYLSSHSSPTTWQWDW